MELSYAILAVLPEIRRIVLLKISILSRKMPHELIHQRIAGLHPCHHAAIYDPEVFIAILSQKMTHIICPVARAAEQIDVGIGVLDLARNGIDMASVYVVCTFDVKGVKFRMSAQIQQIGVGRLTCQHVLPDLLELLHTYDVVLGKLLLELGEHGLFTGYRIIGCHLSWRCTVG